LFTHLREEKGYTYGAYSNIAAQLYRGTWTAVDGRPHRSHARRAPRLMAEITRMRDEAVPQKEFDDRRRSIIASFALTLESPAAVLNLHVTRWLYSLPADYWDKVPERTMA
jgi:predicted Zn-dependent peptidase